MHQRFRFMAIAAACLIVGASAQGGDGGWDDSSIKHVLLISIDGMHAVDFKNCAEGVAGVNDGKPYCPNLAELSKNWCQLRCRQHIEALGLVSGTDEHCYRGNAAHHGCLL